MHGRRRAAHRCQRRRPRHGTTLSVRDLFFKSRPDESLCGREATENYHLTSIVTHYALAHPEIAFTSTNNGREILRVSPAKRSQRTAHIRYLAAGLFESLIPVDGGREYIANSFRVCTRHRVRGERRAIRSIFLLTQFRSRQDDCRRTARRYRSVLPHGVYPVAFLFVDIPLEEIDVNVHPAKTEIRFRRTEAVKDVIAEAVRGALASAGIVAERSFVHPEPETLNSEVTVEAAAEPITQSIHSNFG